MFVITLVLAIIILLAIKSCIRPKDFPKGPLLLPFIGTLWSLPSRFCENKVSEWKKKYGNIIGHKIGNYGLVMMCGNEEIIDAFKHPNFQGRMHSKYFMQRTFNASLGFFFSDDKNWSEVRRFTVRYFGQIFNSKLESIMYEELLDYFSRLKPGEITNICSSFLPIPLNIMMKILVGKSRNDHKDEMDKMQLATNKSFLEGRVTGAETFYHSFRIFPFTGNKYLLIASKYIQDFFQKCLEERKATFNPSAIDDYTDAFLLQQENEKQRTGSIYTYSDQEYISCAVDMVQAGSEGTVKTLQFLLLYVALNPRVQKKLHEEIDRVVGQSRLPLLEDRKSLPYVEATIYEVMRVNPITPLGVLHRATQDTKFKKYFIPEDTLIFFCYKEYLHDSDTWNNPEEFLPERFIENPALKRKVIVFGIEILVKNSVFLYVTYFFQKYSIHVPDGYSNPSTLPTSGIANGPRPFKLIIKERS